MPKHEKKIEDLSAKIAEKGRERAELDAEILELRAERAELQRDADGENNERARQEDLAAQIAANHARQAEEAERGESLKRTLAELEKSNAQSGDPVDPNPNAPMGAKVATGEQTEAAKRRADLEKQAQELEIDFPHNIGDDTLQEKIDAKLGEGEKDGEK